MAHDIPTEAELAILRVLWRLGRGTVRQVHDELAREQGTGYTTTLKLMQIMHQRGLVTRDTSARSHVYEPVRSQSSVQGRLVGNLIDKVFGGSSAALVMRALQSQRSSPDELKRIRAMLDDLDKQEEP